MIKKNQKNSPLPSSTPGDIANTLSNACEGLYYVSETDAEIVPFVTDEIKDISRESILQYCGANSSSNIEIVEQATFFTKLTQMKDWFGPADIARAERFLRLQQLLLSQLTGIKVYRVGTVRIDIILAGHDKSGNVAGIRTIAVET